MTSTIDDAAEVAQVTATESHRPWDPRGWPLAARVVTATFLLSAFAIAGVGTYLSSVIADGLYEQRRDRVLEDSADIRTGLQDDLRQLSGATTTQRQDAVTAFVSSVGGPDGSSRRDAALVPVDSANGVWPVASDRALLDAVDDSFSRRVAASPDALVWESTGRTGADGGTRPSILVGTRVIVPGGGSYDLYLSYSLDEEQATLWFVQRVMAGGGMVLLAILVGIGVVVARLVTTPLRRAALAAEKIAAGDLSSRVQVAGADELARVGSSFNRMASTLQQKVEDLTELSRVQQRFVSDVSHELRTPLTTIRMATAVLEDNVEQFGPDVTRTVELLSAQVHRFEGLLADLLEISRYDAGAVELEAQREDVDELVRRALADVRPVALDRGCTIVERLAGHGMLAVVDARRVDRILRNLLTNAVEHGRGGPILVETGGSGDGVAVVVQDFDVGISPEHAARVFDRFWRADPSRARTLGGTGLGLAISVEDAHLHGGWLQAWGERGEGAVMRLTLPRRPGSPLVRSPLPLERPFDLAAVPDQAQPDQPVGPADLPDLEEER